MTVKTYDPKKVAIVIGGVPMSGFADDTFVKVSRKEDLFTMYVGADGETARAKSNNRSGEMTLTLAQTSPSNDVLSAFHLADELDNAGVVPILIKDLSGTSVFFSAAGWIRKAPDAEFGKEINTREWVFDLAAVDVFVGGNTGNV